MAGTGTLALIGGSDFGAGDEAFDADLVAASETKQVVVLATAAAMQHPDRLVERAAKHFSPLGAEVVGLPVYRRADAEKEEFISIIKDAKFVYITDGSPMLLRAALFGSPLFDAIREIYEHGAVLAASGAGATVLCDPMVDPRGGAYTVGFGLIQNLAVFPYHGTAASHLRERSIELLPDNAMLVGIDEQTALIRSPKGEWRVAGAGEVTVYGTDGPMSFGSGKTVSIDR